MSKQSRRSYSWLHIAFHWTSAITVVGLFSVGLWMVELDYYSPWYKVAPDWHKSIGLLLFLLTLLRLSNRLFSASVAPLLQHPKWQKRAASLTHVLLYCGLFGLFVSGYLISTANGESIKVFSWFEIPALIGFENQADIAGLIHKYTGYALISLVVIHALAGLKHHFIDKDETLKRMLRQYSKTDDL